MTQQGAAWSVFRATVPDTNEEATQIIVLLGDGPPHKQVSFFVPADGPQPVAGEQLEWGTNHVDCHRGDGTVVRLHKIGFDFDPDRPLR